MAEAGTRLLLVPHVATGKYAAVSISMNQHANNSLSKICPGLEYYTDATVVFTQYVGGSHSDGKSARVRIGRTRIS